MNLCNPHLQVSIQRQLKDDWDNREFIQLISDNVKHIADFLSQFGKFFVCLEFLLENKIFMFFLVSKYSL